MDKKEVSFGTLGPSLAEYGKIRKFALAEAKQAYAKIYNSHAVEPCSNMPRFGSNKSPDDRADQGRHGLPDVAGQPGQQVT